MLSKQENDARLELYKKGYSDRMIAEELYLSRSSVAHWRTKNNLSSNYNIGERLSYRLKLYNAGCTDREISEKCGITQNSVRRWRCDNKLRCNYVVENRNKYKK